MSRYNQRFSDWRKVEDKISLVNNEWENFIKTGKANDKIVSPEIISSWTRCRDRGLDPYNIPYQFVSEEELNKRVKINERLIEVVNPILVTMKDHLKGSGFRISLLDQDLIILKRYGDPEMISKLESGPGTILDEETYGTNAANQAILLKKPVQIFASEHYRASSHNLTGMAVPLAGEDGKIMGVISALGYSWSMNTHTFGMIISLAKSIEYNYLQHSIRTKLETTNNYNKKIIESMSEALIVVDKDGVIALSNKIANSMLSPNSLTIVGSTAEHLWGARNPFSEVLNQGESIIDREITLNSGGRTVRLIGNIRPISYDGTCSQGIIGVLRGMNTTQRIIKNFAGWKANYQFQDLVGESPEMKKAIRLAKETSAIQSSILLLGESGTGKELFAQSIHNAGPWRDGPFVAINCAAIPYSLMESELFGYEGGAFTGAKKGGHPGKFELAESGTVFLDEINSMPLDMQAKILRVLQNKTIIRVGGSDEIPVNVRVISASNTDLWVMVRRGEFREDLLYRINVITIKIPPLRERKEDIEPTVRYIIRRMEERNGIKLCIEQATIDLLKQYNWPGNIRELENVLERGSVLSRARGSDTVTVEDLFDYRDIQEKKGDNDTCPGPEADWKTKEEVGRLKDLEKEAILKSLKLHDGNVANVAKSLEISRNTLYRRIKEFGITVEKNYKC